MKNNVKAFRSNLGITQQELADRVGVSRQSINAIEGGKYVPSMLLGLKIARELNMKVEDIFLLDGHA